MVPGVENHQVLDAQTFQRIGTHRTVGSVELEPARRVDPQFGQTTCDRPADDAEAAFLFADVVQQRRSHQIQAVRVSPFDCCRSVQSVALIRLGLGPKQGLHTWLGEPANDQSSLVMAQGSGNRHRKEPAGQVPPGGVHLGRLDLQLTHRMDAGRASSRASEIGVPQPAQTPYVPFSIDFIASSISAT